jgi:hypothetical protein
MKFTYGFERNDFSMDGSIMKRLDALEFETILKNSSAPNEIDQKKPMSLLLEIKDSVYFS